MTVEDIFHAAVEKGAAERAAFLDAACGHDPGLRVQVEALLRSHEEAGSLLEQPLFRAASTAALPSADSAGMAIGPYRLLQQIGEGGMGTVFMAEQTDPVRRKVAVKIIKAGMESRQVVARFEAERQALALMDHVNIARVFDGGTTENGRPYFVMELVHGVPITKYCDDNHLTPRERLELFVPVCQAIQHAHQKGVIHRDIKPSNVMITLYDGKPVPKVIDFGVAKATEQKLTDRTLFTQYGTMVGTLEYMSPEQAEMSALGVDTRSDIYSLGVLLYELLTGTTPLSHTRLKEAAYGEVLRMIREEEPPRPSTRLSESGVALASISAQRHMEPIKLMKLMRGELDWIAMKTLEKDRNRRYETANGLAADIQRYLADETVQACPPSAMYRLRKFVRRNRGPVLAVALLIAVLLAGIAGTSAGLVSSERSRSDAIEAKNAEADQRKAAEASDKEAREAGGKLREARDELRSSLYAARSNLLQSAWEARNVTRMRELLAAQKPGPGEPELRGFEWHYWDRRANAELTIGPPASEYEMARVSWRMLSPDGRRQAIVWASRSNERGDRSFSKIEVRHALTGAPVISFDLSIPIAGRQSLFTYPWLSFTADGEGLFATWNPESKKAETRKVHWWLFDAATGKELVSNQVVACEEMHTHLLSPGRHLVAGPSRIAEPAKGVRLQLWSLTTGQEVRACDGTFEALHATAFRPDEKEVAAIVASAGAKDAVVKVWDITTGRERLSLPAGSVSVRGLAWSPDGRRLAVASPGLRIWDAADGREVLALTATDGLYERVIFSPTGDRLVCVDAAGPTRFVTLRDTATGRTRATLLVPEEQLWGVAFSANGDRLVSLARFGTVRTWDATQSDLPVELPSPPEAALRDAENKWNTSISADGTCFAAAGGGKIAGQAILHVWDPAGKSLFSSTRPSPPDQRVLAVPVHSVTLSPDGRQAAWVYGTGWGASTEPEGVRVHLIVIDVATGTDLWSRDLQSVSPIEFSPDGRWLAAHMRPHRVDKNAPTVGVKILEVMSGREVYSFQTPGCGNLHFSSDGNRLVGLGSPGPGATESTSSLRVWDLQTGADLSAGNQLPNLGESPGMAQMALSPDGTKLAVSWRGYFTGEGKVRMFDVPSGRELRPLKGLDAMLSAVAFSRDGTRLAASGHTVKIWDTATCQELITLRDPPGGILKFSDDGHRLTAVAWLGDRHVLKTWDATPRK